jgi:hypothetical protein
MTMLSGLLRAAPWVPRPRDPQRLSANGLIPEGSRALDRRQSDFLRRSIRQLIRHGAWEQAWALIELSTEEHRYNPAFHRACEQLRRQLSRRLHARPEGSCLPLPDLVRPFQQLSALPQDALIHVDPQAIRHWGCVLFPGIVRGRFKGPRWRRFCNAALEERYLFRGLALNDDPQVRILQRRFQQGLSWHQSGAQVLFAERRARRRDPQTTWAGFQQRQLANWDRLFRTIRSEGYRSQAELQAMGEALPRYGLFNEVEVCVNAKGKLLFLEGKHRLVMAQILGLPSIPVIVNVWSQDFLASLPGPFTPQLAQAHLQIHPSGL